jgi:hypothetical protein
MVPDHPILDATLFTVVAFIVVSAIAFIVKFIRAPVALYQDEKAKADAVSAEEMTARRAHTEAIKQQTEEMWRQREQREREHDPALRAFREQRFRTISTGGGIEEQSFDILVYWIAVRSAWGKWQVAQNKLPINPETGEPHNYLKALLVATF